VPFWEGIGLALTWIRSEKLKSFFSVLGVILGVTFLVLVVSIVEGIDRYVTEDLGRRVIGVNTITVRRAPASGVQADDRARRERTRREPVTFDDAARIEARLSVPARVAVESETSGEVRAENGRTATNVSITAASPEIFEVRDWVVEFGRAFTEQEAERGVAVAVLGYGTAEVLFPSVDPVGRTVRVGGFPYRVVGVLEEQGSLFGQSLDGTLVAPARSPVEALAHPRGNVDAVVVQTLDVDDRESARDQIVEIMRTERRLRPGQENDFTVETAEDAIAFWDRISRILFVALPGLVSISLVVGGIVIMNIMLVSVLERTREIGVRKAVGARRRDILAQVLVESATLSGLGALIGITLGSGLAALIQAVSPLPAEVAPLWVGVALALGVGTGMAAGAYPAVRASRLDPIDALRHE